MNEECKKKFEEFKNYTAKMEYLSSACGVLEWDTEVYIPSKGVPYRSEIMGYLSGELYKLQTSDTIKEFIDYFSQFDDLDDITKAMVRDTKKNYEETKKIPQDRFVEYSMLVSNSGPVWRKAKAESNFNIFKPYLEKIVDFEKEFIGYLGYKDNKYNTLLDLYEPGFTVEKLDNVFGELKESIIALLDKIKASDVIIKDDCFKKKFPKEDQKSFCDFVLRKMEFDFDAGRVDESEHPFTTEFCNKDVRITNHYYENEFRSAIFSAIHEGGHALYEQDIPDELQGTLLGHGVSMGVHESQSRLYENIIGRSREFWTYFYPEVCKRFSQFEGISFDDFYAGINKVMPSLIRTEADELTYSLHIIIRYEIEKALMNDEIKVEDLPDIWNKKYKEYLGVEPQNDKEGVLQDMHWAGGSFGYFPSYALGNLYGAQFLNKMEKDVPSIHEDIKNGKLNTLHEWLKQNVHKYGSVYKPADLIVKVTGEELNAKYFIDYLNKKYSSIYKL